MSVSWSFVSRNTGEGRGKGEGGVSGSRLPWGYAQFIRYLMHSTAVFMQSSN